MRGLSQLKNGCPVFLSIFLTMNTCTCLVSANDVMQRYVMEHFVFPGNTDFTADDLGAKCHSCTSL